MLTRIPGFFNLIVRIKDENITEINIMIENIMMTTIPYYLRTKGLLYIFLASAKIYKKKNSQKITKLKKHLKCF